MNEREILYTIPTMFSEIMMGPTFQAASIQASISRGGHLKGGPHGE
jgi:hypothetical protein